MPMFYTPSPRKFHYTPRFYDPEKEEWNKMKQRYGIDGKAPIATQEDATADYTTAESTTSEATTHKGTVAENSTPTAQEGNTDLAKEIAYFEARDRELTRQEKAKQSKFGWQDLFRKREMPKFNYQPRFSEGGTPADPVTVESEMKAKKKRISRRFDIEDTKYFEPIPAGKIMLYALGATLLLAWIFLF